MAPEFTLLELVAGVFVGDATAVEDDVELGIDPVVVWEEDKNGALT